MEDRNSKFIFSWEIFIRFTAVLSFLIICLGFGSLILFYWFFNVAIAEYLSVSEIVVTSFSFLLRMTFPVLAVVLFLQKTIIDAWIERKDPKELYRIMYKPFKIIQVIIAILFLSLLLIPIIKYSLSDLSVQVIPEYYIFSGIILIILGYYTGVVKIIYNYAFSKTESNNLGYYKTVIIGLIATSIYLFIFSIYFRTENVKNSNLISSFHLSNDSTISTNDSIKFIGKTEGYYFLWNKKTKVSTIYPASEIKRIDIKP